MTPHTPPDDRHPAAGAALIGRLLAGAAIFDPLPPVHRAFSWTAGGGAQRQFRWAMAGGLGPLLHRGAAPQFAAMPRPWRDELLAADLTARVRHADLVDTTLEIVSTCAELGVDATLLKGVSVSEELYPAEHLRPMADVDVLIPAAVYARVEAALLAHGYERLPYPHIEGHHHGAPLRHARRRTLVELHTRLFPETSPLHAGAVFGTANVRAQSSESRYHGRPVRRLTAELQLAYIASSWFNDMTSRGFHPSFIVSLFDAVFLLKARGHDLDWTGMPGWIDNDAVKGSLYAMLTYLPRFGVRAAPSPVLRRLALNAGWVGPIQLRLIHAALDRYLIGGRAWPFALPPPMPGRYSPKRQLRKRVSGPHRRSEPESGSVG